MEVFRDNFKPLQITIQDSENKQHIINTNMLTIKKMKKIEKIREEAKLEGNEVKATELLYTTLEIMFNKPREFWDDYSIEFLNQIVTYATEKMSKKKDKE